MATPDRYIVAMIFGSLNVPNIGDLRGCVVSTAKEFYENAAECFRWAKTAKTERERLIFMQMRDAWLEVARKRQTKEAQLDPHNRPQNAA